VRQETEREVGPRPHAPQSVMEGPHQAAAVGCAQVCALLALDVAPERFDGIEFGGVGGQPFDGEPVPLRHQVALRHPAAVRGRPSQSRTARWWRKWRRSAWRKFTTAGPR
jgi:hypothetical protein